MSADDILNAPITPKKKPDDEDLREYARELAHEMIDGPPVVIPKENFTG